jgi:phosphocarrier protein FPr/phosphocarrier protein
MRAIEKLRPLVLVAPLAGWSTPLAETPDPVFSGRMLGDGLAIDPTGCTLHAPCDGEVIALPESRHAVTLRTESGADILMHVGIDTVGLAGEGFEALVKLGQRVVAGQRLLAFDLDLLGRRAKSLLTPILVMEGCGFTVVRSVENHEIGVGDVLMEIAPVEEAGRRSEVGQRGSGETPKEAEESRRVRVALEHGIHARPAAHIASVLKGLAAEVRLAVHERTANARSTVALMKLGAHCDDEVEIRASGSDAVTALNAVAALLTAARTASGASAPTLQRTTPTRLPRESAPMELSVGTALPGVIASRGLAVGEAVPLRVPEIEIAPTGAGASHEAAALERARAQVRSRLEAARASASSTARDIIEAHLALLEDPELADKALSLIAAGASAAYAWRQAVRDSIEALRALDDPRMAERVDDLLDLERQVLLAAGGHAGAAIQELPRDAILVAEELLPSQLVTLDAARLAGICLAAGGATSHVSILAAAMGIPTLVALGPQVRGITAGTPLLLDADAGLLRVNPGAERLAAARRELEMRIARNSAEREAAQQDCRTADGERIELFANIGSLAEAQAAARNGAEGCGLLRTEFLFLERATPPSEAEQRAEYQQLAAALPGRPMTIRTLDVGGDKPIPYLPMPPEENPALGLRGVRTSLRRPDLLRQQLRAILGVTPFGQCRILLPMISDVAEIRSVRAMIEEARTELGRREPIEVGVMIETPASALMADSLAAEADFFSIGTNDLTQYTLAMDRGHPELAARLDALHPAVLRLIARAAEAAHARKRLVAVCGGLASDLAAAPILIGLGVHELSAVPAVIPQLKALIRKLTLKECAEAAQRALEQSSAAAVRALGARLAARENQPQSV